MTATSFILLAITGLILLYGKIFLKPLFGAGAYSALATGSAYVHIAFMVPFVLGAIIMIVVWIRQNVVTGFDMHWLARFGGFLSHSSDRSEEHTSELQPLMRTSMSGFGLKNKTH